MIELSENEYEQLVERVAAVEEQNAELEAELAEQREKGRQRDRQINELQEENEQLHEETERLQDRVAELEDDLEEAAAKADGSLKKSSANKDRIVELQGRELEKGAHLREENVDTMDVDVEGGRLETIQKEDDNSYFRIPEADDPLNRGGATALAHGDLLPIQQLAQMDDDMLHSSTSDLPSRLAAKLWKARTDDTFGDNPWEKGSKDVREYVKASDLKHWIRRQENGVSESYAKKLVSRTIDRLMEFSNNRLGIRKKSERKNGLSYKERRVLLKTDAEIPGETTTNHADQDDAPETAGVVG